MKDQHLKKLQNMCIAAIFICLLFGAKACIGQTSSFVRNVKNMPDDAKHVYAGAIIAGVTTDITFKYTDGNYGKAYLAGLLAGTIAGGLKEWVYDHALNKGVPTIGDFVFTSYGAFLGTGIISLYKHHQQTKLECKIDRSKHILD